MSYIYCRIDIKSEYFKEGRMDVILSTKSVILGNLCRKLIERLCPEVFEENMPSDTRSVATYTTYQGVKLAYDKFLEDVVEDNLSDSLSRIFAPLINQKDLPPYITLEIEYNLKNNHLNINSPQEKGAIRQ